MAGRLPRVTGAVGSIDTAGEGGFYGGHIYQPSNPATATSVLVANNDVRVYQFVLPFRVVIGKIVFEVSTTAASGLCSVGLYDVRKNRVVHAGAISTTSAGIKDIDLSASVTVEPGVYYVAFTGDNTTFKLRAITRSALQIDLERQNAVRSGTSANDSVSGVLPTALGDLTDLEHDIAGVWFEP